MARFPLRATAFALVVAVLPAATAEARQRAVSRPEAAAKPFFDVRTASRQRAGNDEARPGKVLRDAVTGTVRAFNARDGALTGPSARSAVATARAFARARADRLGLSAADVDSLVPLGTERGAEGLRVVRFVQQAGGIPYFDNGLEVGLDRAGRVVSASGSPVHDPGVASTVPRLSATEAMEALRHNVGAVRAPAVTAPARGLRRFTRFAGRDTARLVLFRTASGTRLAWRLTLRANAGAHYHAVVDATSGAVLYRANLVKFVDQQVFFSHPGEPGGPHTVDIAPYLSQYDPQFPFPGFFDGSDDQTTGPYSYTYSDVDSNDQPSNQEHVDPTPPPAGPTFTPVAGFGCDSTHLCAWDETDPNSWLANQDHSVIQAQWYAGNFHDHLALAPIGFTDAGGNFECQEQVCQVNFEFLDPDLSDPVEINSLDGAATGTGGGPDEDHLNNANMLTFPDGIPPLMQMYLFDSSLGAPSRFRDIDGDDDAGTVYHEYTHGLSNRLITDADGFGALNSPHAGAMGEAWSDWYAMDYLVRAQPALHPDTSAPGEVDVGYYSDFDRHATRYNPQDCPVSTAPAVVAQCPGGKSSGPGGFTLGDFGKVHTRPEVHSDGEIWMETLWDLRTALIAANGGSASAGSDEAELLVTNGMRLSPSEPSFLDMRNAILAADAARGGPRQALLWSVFAARGMGYYAAAVDGADTSPVEDFNTPPAAGAPTGTLSGRVTDADSGLGVASVPVQVAGQPGLRTITAADGSYSVSLPAATYPKLVVPPTRGYDGTVLTGVTVTGGQTTTRDLALRFDWAALRAGASVTDNETQPFPGCASQEAIDQSLGTGWSPFRSPTPQAVIQLPAAITVSEFGMDPGNACGDDPSAATKGYRVETSPNGTNWTVALTGSFAPADAHRLNLLKPTAAAENVKFVRLTLLSPQSTAAGGSGADFVDFSEFEVYGNKPNVLPTGTLAADPPAAVTGQNLNLTAAFSDPDSAITGYDWDFDGDGVVDRSTPAPTTDTSFATTGERTVSVAAKDFRGGAGSATATVTVARAAAAKPKVKIAASGKRSVKVTVTCDSACTVRGTLKVTTKLRRKLGLKSRTVGRLKGSLKAAGKKTFRLKLTAKSRRAMKARALRSIRPAARVTATDAEKQKATAKRSPRIRR